MIHTAAPVMTEEEYIQHELRAERRSEFINGKLFEMPGEADINNQMAGDIAFLLRTLLGRTVQLYTHDMKVGIPGGSRYSYPDLFMTHEERAASNRFIKREPVLIVEVVSEGSHHHDYVDKFIDYTKIPSLQYYLIAEPETILITAYERSGDEWVARKYTKREDAVKLPLLGIELPLSELYSGA